ncbi:ERF family protein [Priestia aryabhattai]|uniref:ERF family protein n=1 Tax=Priestia aryabhattai TaxID=412384 RepID=UPI0039A26A31
MSEQTEAPKLNLYQKIHAVMQDVEYIEKDSKVEFKTTKYKAVSEEAVTTAVRNALVKYGLVILPVEQEHSKDGTITTVDVKYKIIDIDTGNHEIVVSSGTGADTQDKGVGKAMTYSYKYMLLRTFAIPTGEDPDRVSSAELDEKQKPSNNGSNKPSNTGGGKPVGGGNLATENQLNFVNDLLNKKATREMPRKQLYEHLKHNLGTQLEMEEWTFAIARKAIELLQALKSA